ncbi:S-layer homology domain-containing protein [Gorillibacterium sp. sgz5001074]|uniref:S-layer homology domain-containing protein n=1 Tax=Gorillibacterium sp. sgz5001074 TaxID=3446695 RepID=UPI003F673989
MKKKAIAVALVASMTVPATLPAVGIPLVDSHLAGGKASAAGLPNEVLQKRLQNLHKILAQTQNLDLAEKFRNYFKGLNTEANLNLATNQELVSALWTKINAKKGNQPGYELITQKNILRLFLEFAVTYDPQGKSINDVITDPELKPIMDQLLKLSGLPGGLNDFTLNDFNLFLNAVSPELKTKLKSQNGLNNAALLNLATSFSTEYGRLVYTGDAAVTNLKVSKVLSGLNLTAADWSDVVSKAILRVLGPVDNGGGNGGNGGNGGGGGGGGGGTGNNGGTVTNPDGTKTATYDLTDAQIAEMLKNVKDQTIVLDLSGQTADHVRTLIPAKLWPEAEKLSVQYLNVKFPNGVSYLLPFDGIDVNKIAASLNVDLKDLKFEVQWKKLNASQAAEFKNKATAAGLTVTGEVYEFSLVAVTPKGNTEIKSFSGNYSFRSITLDSEVNPNEASVLTLDAKGNLQFVPATFTKSGGKTTVTFRRGGNSVYGIVKANKTFADISGHWAESDVKLLASKLLVQGVTDTRFEPEATVKRSEFATLLVRALGLVEEEGVSTSFSDIPASYWAAGSIRAAVQSGLIKGFEDGTFRPESPITREEMAVMISRALKQAGKVPQANSSVLQYFKDYTSISKWSEDAMAQVVKAGIFQGVGDQQMDPEQTATRAQAAAVFKRLLVYAEFIN